MIVREVFDFELPLYATHLKSLDNESRALRFCFSISDEMIDAFVNKLKPTENKLFCVEQGSTWLGVGHIHHSSAQVELAFSVLSGHQGRGIGDSLMKRCIAWCKTHGYLQGELVCLPSNKVIQHLCRKNGITIEGSWDERSGKFELEKPSSAEFVMEALSEHVDRITWVMNRTLTPWFIKQEGE